MKYSNDSQVSCVSLKPSSFQERCWSEPDSESTIYLSGPLHLPQESCFIIVLAALFPLKTTSRTTINLGRLAGALHDLYVCTLSVCVAGVFPRKEVFLQLAEQE